MGNIMKAAVGLMLASVIFAIPARTVRAETSVLTFAVLSDIHVQSWDKRSIRKFGAALDDVRKAAPQTEALVLNGDLGNGDPDDYQMLNRILDRHPHPAEMYYTIGNHEFYKAWHDRFRRPAMETFPNGESERQSVSRFLRQSGEAKVYYKRVLKGYTFLFLGTEQYRQTDPANKEDAFLSKEQLQWLSEQLEEADKSGKPIFVFLHQPLPGTVSGSDVPGNGKGVVQAEELRARLSAYPRVILFTGHTHFEWSLPQTVVRDKFAMVNCSSVGDPRQGTDEPYPPEQGRSEGVVVEAYPDRVLIKGRAFHDGRWLQAYALPFD
ncbi:3',5'-cyclic adenosine monophosphate phosphodiesterase CpdA [Paenibacillus solanacearum]|uniref:3',5'-cyclic adenosine monophosphate phosphodiesterase CpdA n=1 Tax=Paenibacillus solanacearum TaxID=2048548 RepID=A0A916K8C1_9BACL|nr:metallophosphoesterase [Paenibacillus solanacearum]CAG7645052.1 3',5'-cyclic adenosine monophosphate phosphodiesterase CpdA [Paenibacillus solanacearum]